MGRLAGCGANDLARGLTGCGELFRRWVVHIPFGEGDPAEADIGCSVMGSADDFLMTVDTGADGPVLFASADLDLATANAFRDALRDLLEAQGGRATIDMRAVGFIDSSGLAVVAGAVRDGFTIKIRHPSTQVRAMLKVSGLWAMVTGAS